ncbi:MAG: hypothetical protein HYX20_03310 [Candidatus Yanofskybacteria bacterium]|nr:hypothetical protein [Candidatus Yanofskybacteria bacterium]
MSSIFAKLVLSFASILGLVSAPTYIQLNTASIVFDYKTGESRPLYYLNVKNVGPQRERFDVSANVPWIFISREGYDNVASLHLESESAVNFTLDIRPEMVADGSHSGRISVKVADVYTYSVIETKTVEVTFNKNFVITISPSPFVSPTSVGTTPEVEPSVEVQPQATLTPSSLPLFSSIPKKPSPFVISSATPPTPTARITASPATSLPTQLRSVITPTPSISISLKPKASRAIFPFRSFWQFLRNFLF